MELLNLPFHDPPRPGCFRIAKASNEPDAIEADGELDHAPGPSSVPTINLLPASPTKSEEDLGLSAPSSSLASSLPPLSISDESEHQSGAGSYTSSLLITRKTNKAFNKLRTAYNDDMPAIPHNWVDYQPPSLKQGHYRTFGPIALKCWSVPAEPKQPKSVRKRIRDAPCSSCAQGTVWRTGDKVMYILSEGTAPVSQFAKATAPGNKDFTQRFSWFRSARKPEQASSCVPQEGPLPATVEGHSLSGIQLRLSDICRLKHSKAKDGIKSPVSLSRRSSQASAPSALNLLEPPSKQPTSDPSLAYPTVTIDAQNQQRYVRWELCFGSALYAQEAQDLIDGIESFVGISKT